MLEPKRVIKNISRFATKFLLGVVFVFLLSYIFKAPWILILGLFINVIVVIISELWGDKYSKLIKEGNKMPTDPVNDMMKQIEEQQKEIEKLKNEQIDTHKVFF